MKRTKAERLRDLAEDIEKEGKQPIYNHEEFHEMLDMAGNLKQLAQNAEEGYEK